MFEAPIFTDGGRLLLNRAIAGENLVFTCIKMGQGSIGDTDISTLTDLIDPVVSLDIYKVTAEEDTATITASFSNEDISSGFLFKELGLFAQDPDGGDDILYCYQNAYDTADYISSAGSELIERQISIISIVGSAANVSATVDGSVVYVTWKELEEYLDSHPRVFIQATEPDTVNCIWIKPDADSGDTDESEIGLLSLSDDLESSDYYAEIDGEDKAIENVVETDSELTEGNYRFQII